MAYQLPASVTKQTAAAISVALAAAMRAGERVVDAGAVTESDSTLVAILLQARRIAADVQLTGVSSRVLQLATLYGVHEFVAPIPAVHHT